MYTTEWRNRAGFYRWLAAALLVSALLVWAPIPAQAQVVPGTITTVAGSNQPGSARCTGLALDAPGNLYFADGYVVRKVAAGTGLVTTVAGRAAPGAESLVVDKAGDLYIAGRGTGIESLIWKMASKTGVITAVAGTGKPEPSDFVTGDGGPATGGYLTQVTGLAFDAEGNLYIAEAGHNRIRRIAAATGVITTAAARNLFAQPSPGRAKPSGIAFDAAGNLYIADAAYSRVLKVAAGTGAVTRIAGTGEFGYSGDGVPATLAKLNGPAGLVFDAAGNLYIADTGNHRVRMVAKGTGAITTVAGNGTGGYDKFGDGDGGLATGAMVSFPSALALDGAENLYICGGGVGGGVRKVADVRRAPAAGTTARLLAPGAITTLAGNGTRIWDGDGKLAVANGLINPVGVSVDSTGNVFIVDRDTHSVLKVAAGTGIIARVAGGGGPATPRNLRPAEDGGPATAASLLIPQAVTVDGAGNLYIGDYGHSLIREVAAPSGIITSLLKQFANMVPDGVPLAARSAFHPSGLALDAKGDLYIADESNECVRKFSTASHTVTTVAGTCEQGASGGYAGDGGLATSAKLANPSGIALSAAGDLYIADRYNFRIRKVAANTGIITTIAGTDRPGFSGDGGPAGKAQLNNPTGVAVDAAGSIFIADMMNHRVRKVSARTGIITTLAGTGEPDFGGDGGPAASAHLNGPVSLALDSSGNLYIAEPGNNRVRKVIGAAQLP